MTLFVISRMGVVHDGTCIDSRRAQAADRYRVVSANQVLVFKLDRCPDCFRSNRIADWNAAVHTKVRGGAR